MLRHMKKLQSLDEWNSKSAFIYTEQTYPMPNGIECPKCGSEMSDMDDLVLCCYPPKKNIECLGCGHKNYRLA